MSNTVIVKYRCTHISCRNPKCYEGSLKLSSEAFDLLHQAEGGSKFRSPSTYCKIASTQVFEILEKSSLEDTPLEIQIDAIEKTLKELQVTEQRLLGEQRQVTNALKENAEKIKKANAKLQELKGQKNASND